MKAFPETVRVGLIGGGYMAKTHTLGYRNAGLIYGADLPRVELVALAEVTDELAAAAANRWGWGRSTSDWRSVVEAEDVDLVDVVTPNAFHAEIAIAAAEAGKHVICEKPLASNLDEAYAMLAAADAAGVITQTGFYYRLWPAVREARRLIDAGTLGAVRHVRGRFFQDYAAHADLPFSWRFDAAAAGAGALGDIGSHILDLVRHLAGEVDAIVAHGRTLVPQRPAATGSDQLVDVDVDVDDLYSMLLSFASGATGSVEASWAATGHKCDLGFEVIGDAGSLQFTWERSNELRLYLDADDRREQGFRTVMLGGMHEGVGPFWFAPGQGIGYGDAFTMGMGELLAAIRDERAAQPNFLDGLRAAEIVAAALESHERSEWVDVERRGGGGDA
jgi:predicted dehydrogenase